MFTRDVARAAMLGFLLVAGSAQAGNPRTYQQTCPATMADAADAMVDELNDWAAVANFYRKYRQCDDGGIAEESSEAIARLLVGRWETLPQLKTLAKAQPGLHPFVVNHVNSTLDTGDLNQIVHNASVSCPKATAELCKDVREAAEEALK